jgi:hypothetical protein
MNYATLKSKFSSATLGAGCSSFDFSFLYELNFDRDIDYPKGVLVPPTIPVYTDSNQEEVEITVEDRKSVV